MITKWPVVTQAGITHSEHSRRESAEVAAQYANRDAERLGLKNRYVVSETPREYEVRGGVMSRVVPSLFPRK